MSNPIDKKAAEKYRAFDANRFGVSPPKRPTWEQTDGTSLPLGATWMEDEEAFNFAVYAEHAENVTLLLYSADDLANPILTFQFDYFSNKSGRIWHCRLPSTKCAVLVITPTRSRAKQLLGCTGSIPTRSCSILMLSVFSSHPNSIAKWQLGPAPTREKHRSESSLATISPSIGQGTFHLTPNPMQSSMNFM